MVLYIGVEHSNELCRESQHITALQRIAEQRTK